MKGQPEPAQDTGLGKKVQDMHAPEPVWKAVPGRPGFYVNAKGQLKYAPRWHIWTNTWH